MINEEVGVDGFAVEFDKELLEELKEELPRTYLLCMRLFANYERPSDPDYTTVYRVNYTRNGEVDGIVCLTLEEANAVIKNIKDNIANDTLDGVYELDEEVETIQLASIEDAAKLANGPRTLLYFKKGKRPKK